MGALVGDLGRSILVYFRRQDFHIPRDVAVGAHDLGCVYLHGYLLKQNTPPFRSITVSYQKARKDRHTVPVLVWSERPESNGVTTFPVEAVQLNAFSGPDELFALDPPVFAVIHDFHFVDPGDTVVVVGDLEVSLFLLDQDAHEHLAFNNAACRFPDHLRIAHVHRLCRPQECHHQNWAV